jgi:hypothetical protein
LLGEGNKNGEASWVYTGLFTLISITYMDRIAPSVAANSLSEEFGLSPIRNYFHDRVAA